MELQWFLHENCWESSSCLIPLSCDGLCRLWNPCWDSSFVLVRKLNCRRLADGTCWQADTGGSVRTQFRSAGVDSWINFLVLYLHWRWDIHAHGSKPVDKEVCVLISIVNQTDDIMNEFVSVPAHLSVHSCLISYFSCFFDFLFFISEKNFFCVNYYLSAIPLTFSVGVSFEGSIRKKRDRIFGKVFFLFCET